MNNNVESHNTNNNKSFMDKIIEYVLSLGDKATFTGKDKILFYKELVYMIKGGVSIMEAVHTIQNTSDNYAIKMVSKEIAKFLNEGKELSYAINRLPEYFDEGDAAIIKTGEKSGNLPEVLQSLSEEYSYLYEIKQKYIGAMIYPAILIVISLVAIIYLFGFVLPGIFDTLSSSVTEMPTIAMILKSFSNFILSYRKEIIICVVLFILFLIVYGSTEKGQNNIFRIMIKLPIVGNMSKSYYLIKRSRYMKLMISSGMDYVETFRLLRDVLKLPLYQSMIEHVLADISLGKSLYEPISKHSDIIPSNVAVLIRVGEETANLGNAMQNIIDIHQEELDNSIKNLSKAIEPLILVFVGGIVLLIALGIFSLIFAVMDSAGI